MKGWRLPFCGVLIGTVTAWWLYPAASVQLQHAMPTDYWFDVRSVHVTSVRAGESPPVRLEATFHRPFEADWIAILWRQDENGVSDFCRRAGRRDYTTATSLPENSVLDDWLSGPIGEDCPDLEPGTYVLALVWELATDALPPRVLTVESNIFEVKE